MVRKSPDSSTSAEELVAGLVQAAEADHHRRFLEEHPELIRAEVVEELCRQAAETTAVEPTRGGRIAAAALAIARRLESERHIGLALRAQGNALLYQRDYLAARDLYQQAIDSFDTAGDEAEEAVTRSIGLYSLSHLGDPETAFAWAARARAVLERSGDRLALARLEQNLAVVLSRADRFAEAIEKLRFAHQSFLELGEVRHAGVALRNMAVCYQDLNDFHASLRTYEQAWEHCRTHGLTVHLLEVEYNMAYLFYLRGRYAEALRRFEAARQSSTRHDDPHHVALCDLDQAEIYLELNLVAEADELAEAAYDGFGRLGMEYETAKALVYRGIAAGRLGRFDQALGQLDQAQQVFRRQQNLAWQGMVDLYRARLLRASGRWREAFELANGAHSAFSRASVPSRTAVSEILLARLAVDSGNVEQARRWCDQALERVASLDMPALEFQARLVAGQVEEMAKRREPALAAYRQSLESLEMLRGELSAEELRVAFSDGKESLFAGLVRLTLAGGGPAEAWPEAFGYIEKAKSRALADLLAATTTKPEPTASVDPELTTAIGELQDEVRWYYRRIDAAELEPGPSSRQTVAELRHAVADRERRLQSARRRLQALDPELAAIEGARVVDLDSLQALLPEDTVMVEYYYTPDAVYVCLIDRDDLQILQLPAFRDLGDTVRFLEFQLRKFALGPERVGAHVPQTVLRLLGKLHDALIAPFHDRLGHRHLVVVPHGVAHRVPFHALYDGERFLVDRHRISYAPSATVLGLCATRKLRPEPRELVVGVPDRRAPMILEEARAVAAMLPNARLLVGADATIQRLNRLGASCRILHLATHGRFRGDNPMFSAIQLGDSRLSLFDLYGLRFNAELVVLSGCGTGLGEVSGGDELIGLTRGVLYAGSRAVLATLWDVNDESTREFMVAFYRQLETEPNPAAALRAAQLELRERFGEPYYWAPFYLVGWPFGAGTALAGESDATDRA